MAEDNPKTHPRIPRAAARAIALPLRWPAPSRRGAELGGFLARQWEREVEQRRLFPWIAVCFGLGILLFFAADGEPALWSPVGGALSCASAAFADAPPPRVNGRHDRDGGHLRGLCGRHRPHPQRRRARAGADRHRQPAGADRIRRASPSGARLTIQVTSLDRFPAAERPRRVRVTVRDATGLAAGQGIAGTAASCRRCSRPGQADTISHGTPSSGRSVASDHLSAPCQAGLAARRLALGFAAPIELGPQCIDPSDRRSERRPARRRRGRSRHGKARAHRGADERRAPRRRHLPHRLDLGLHMVLAAGTIFWLVRALLALSPAVALLWPVQRFLVFTRAYS